MAYLKAFSTLGCAEATLSEALALAGKFDCGGIELRALGGALDLPAWFEANFGTPGGLAKAMADEAVRVTALDTSLKAMGAKPGDREAFLKFVPWAEALGGVNLRVFDGGKLADEAELAEARALIEWWQALRAENGWASDIMIETHDALVTHAALDRFSAAMPTGTKLLWDTHHTWKKGGEAPVETWRRHQERIVSVHVKDSVSEASARHPFTYVLPGYGEFPMAELKPVLAAEMAGRPLVFEWERVWHPYLQPLPEALTVARAGGWW